MPTKIMHTIANRHFVHCFGYRCWCCLQHNLIFFNTFFWTSATAHCTATHITNASRPSTGTQASHCKGGVSVAIYYPSAFLSASCKAKNRCISQQRESAVIKGACLFSLVLCTTLNIRA